MQCACAIFSSVACPELLCVFTLSHWTARIFENNVTEFKGAFWFSPQLLHATFFILRRTERDGIINVMRIDLHVQCLLSVADLGETRIFSAYFWEILKLYFMKIRTVGAKLVHADGRTYMARRLVAFRDFSTAFKSGTQHERMKYRITTNEKLHSLKLIWKWFRM